MGGVLPSLDPFFTPELTPFTLDQLLSVGLGDGLDPGTNAIFGPQDYYRWCEGTRLPEVFPDPATRPGLDRRNLKDAVKKCGWPTLEELRGRFIVTLHGNFINDEQHVSFYSDQAGPIADHKIFPMASVLGTGGSFSFIFCPNGGVCNWGDNSVFADVITNLDADAFPDEPFHGDPAAAITEFVSNGGIVRSGDSGTRSEMANAIDNLRNLPGLPGYNILPTDFPRLLPVNVEKSRLASLTAAGPVNWATGCLFQGPGSAEFQAGCSPDDLREPGSGILITVFGDGNIDPLNDRIVFLHTARRPGVGSFRAFVSTRTSDVELSDLGDFEGNLGCLMARESTAANAPFFAVCRRGHRASWDSGELGIWVYFRQNAGEPLQAIYQPDTNAVEDTSGTPQVQSYLRLEHSTDGRCFQGYMKSTYDPHPGAGFGEVPLTPAGVCFVRPLSLIGISTNGGRNGNVLFPGQHFFANVRYNNNFLTLAQLSDPSQGGGKMDTTPHPGATGIEDRSFDIRRFAAAFNHPPVARCKDVTATAGPACTAPAFIDNGSFDPDPGDTITLSQNPAGPYSKGTQTVTLTVTDSSEAANAVSTCSATVTVLDQTPPTITRLSVSPTVLGPPDHKMVPITVDAAATDNCGTPVCRVSAVSSDEPPDAHEPDWQITGPLTVLLRAERDGNRDGRTYTLEIACGDADGNRDKRTATVIVPHD